MKINVKTNFTLIEILIVVILIGILAAVVIPQFGDVTSDAKEKTIKNTLGVIRSQLELHKAQIGSYPSAFSEMTSSKTVNTKILGPWLKEIPLNPANELNTIKATGGGFNDRDADNANSGWGYNSSSGLFWATSTGHTAY